jgi:hypothetical protein
MTQTIGQPPNSWNHEKVDQNMRAWVRSPRLRISEYDRQSIMHYSLPANWFIHGTQDSCWVARNDILSETDVETIKQAYPATVQEQADYLVSGRKFKIFNKNK